jgi:hypothetical protein
VVVAPAEVIARVAVTAEVDVGVVAVALPDLRLDEDPIMSEPGDELL